MRGFVVLFLFFTVFKEETFLFLCQCVVAVFPYFVEDIVHAFLLFGRAAVIIVVGVAVFEAHAAPVYFHFGPPFEKLAELSHPVTQTLAEVTAAPWRPGFPTVEAPAPSAVAPVKDEQQAENHASKVGEMGNVTVGEKR